MIICIFDCPIHGPEDGILCFRAFSDEYKSRWKKYEQTLKEIPFENDELDLHLELIKAALRQPVI